MAYSLKEIPKQWAIAAGCGAALVAAIALFWPTPPQVGTGSQFAKWIVGAIVAAMAPVLQRHSQRSHATRWSIATAAVLALGMVLYFAGDVLRHAWIVFPTPSSATCGPIIRGTQYHPRVARMTDCVVQAPSVFDDSCLLRKAQCNPLLVWTDSATIESRQSKLLVMYVAGVILFAVCMLCAAQTVLCATKPAGGKAHA